MAVTIGRTGKRCPAGMKSTNGGMSCTTNRNSKAKNPRTGYAAKKTKRTDLQYVNPSEKPCARGYRKDSYKKGSGGRKVCNRKPA